MNWFLTGYPDIPTTVQAIKAGADDLLTKPVSSEDLLQAIEHAIAHHEMTRGLKSKLDIVRARIATHHDHSIDLPFVVLHHRRPRRSPRPFLPQGAGAILQPAKHNPWRRHETLDRERHRNIAGEFTRRLERAAELRRDTSRTGANRLLSRPKSVLPGTI